jgi:lipoprotein-anchoring transpeptidase ErfK/SrfK
MGKRKLVSISTFLFSLSIVLSIAAEGEQGLTSEAVNSQPANGANLESSRTSVSLETRLVLKLKERRVYVYQGKQAVASYPVAIGKKGWETPKGNFQVIQMIKNPSWQHPWNGKIFPPGPDNPLGERWIGFWTDGKNFIGFHGTPGEHLIGRAVSHGCVRMRNRDVKALFQKVKMGTPVIVQ